MAIWVLVITGLALALQLSGAGIPLRTRAFIMAAYWATIAYAVWRDLLQG